MSEQKSQQKGQKGQSPLQTDKGNTSIQDGVVAKIAGIAAQEVDGIRMGGGASQAASGFIGSLTGGGGGGQTRGVAVEVGEEETAVDLVMTTEAVRRNVINRVENLVGLSVTEVNITVSNIFFPQEEEQQQIEGQ
jgi:uncharacterized alkaline shock family protein YloU